VRARKKILVVDDNAINLSVFEEMLSADYRLQVARSGAEAIKVAEQFQPAVILLDVMMPGMDGLETCRQFRQLAGLSDAVIIMVSAKAMPSEEADGIDAGADEYVTKPFDEVELLDVLRRYANPPSLDRESITWSAPEEVKSIAAY
jgi:CheY-like chemotaxis protein